MTAAWTLHPLYYGEFSAFERSLFVYHRGFGEKIAAPATGWLLARGAERIVVDTGPYEPELGERFHGYTMERSGPDAVRAALAAHGVAPQDVRDVVLTHLHWDHSSNVGLFSRARFHVQRAELEYASAPLAPHRLAYDVGLDGHAPPWRAVIDRMELLDGDAELREGLACHLLPGHTPGSQAVAVQTGGARYLIAGDNVDLAENWAGDDEVPHRPGGIFVDLRAYLESLERMEGLADVVLPAHDFAIFEQKRYPA